MKILLVNKYFYQKGGSETVFFDTIRILRKNGHEVAVLAMENSECQQAPADLQDIAIYTLPHLDLSKRFGLLENIKITLNFFYSVEARNKIREIINKEKPDIAHLHNFAHQISPSILKPLKQASIPIVHTVHDYQLICPNYKLYTANSVCERCFKHKYYNCVTHNCVQNGFWPSLISAKELAFQKIIRSYDQIDCLICPSEFIKNKLDEWGVKNTKKVIHNSVDISEFNKTSEEDDYILYFGRLEEHKGVLTLLKAVKDLPDLYLKVAGTGPQEQTLIDFAHKNKIGNVEFLGFQSGNVLSELICRSRFLVMPSEWYENFPLSGVEACAYGKPIVASNLGGLPEIVKEGENGFLYEAGSTEHLKQNIRLLYDDKQLRDKFSAYSRSLAEEKFDLSKYYQELISLYQDQLK